MKLKRVIELLEQLSPVRYAEDWDNVGLLFGDDEQEIKHIMLALDATDYVVEQAVNQNVDLLLTHHPMIFKSIKQINNHSMVGRRLLKLASGQIAYYAMHTNFDIKGGMAELAERKLGLMDAVPLETTIVEEGHAEGIGRVGYLKKPIKVTELADLIKEKYGLKNVILYGNKEREVHKIAICPGSGKSEIGCALEAKADVLVTGDIGHHDGIDAVDQGLLILDATHYGLEHVFVEYMDEYLMSLPEIQEAGKVEGLHITCMDTGSPVTIL